MVKHKIMSPKPILLLYIILLISCGNDDSTATENNENPVDEMSDNTTPTTFSEFNTIQYKDIQDVDPDLLSLDIFSFEDINNKRPVVLWIHGGAWSVGDKTNQLENKIPYFEDLGYVFVSTNYRLSPFPFELDNPDRLKFPSHVEDIAASVNWIINNISDFGGDPNNIVIMGHSAGAHLVSLAAINPIYLQDFNISTSIFKGVVVFDTQAFNIPLLLDSNQSATTENIYLNAFGSNTNTWEAASPTLNIDNNQNLSENFFIVTRGNILRRNIQEDFSDTLEANNINIAFIDADPLSHEGVNDVIGDTNDIIITPHLTTFLKNVFGE